MQFRNAPVDDLYAALEYLQSLLPAESGFAIGEFSAADIAIAPFLARMRISFQNDIGTFPEGEGPKIYAEITGAGSGKFARLAKYQEDLFARESFKATWDEVWCTAYSMSRAGTDLLQAYVTERFKARFGNLRNQQ